ncbi:hypothetical protein QVD17_27496 [Tagetes erecta]|uniref:Uncharacterized protein n=1 Tax=Tagetes erecta TaxID=13708 RepID=A0AAD8NRP1_TARER|nr:hypothetical protein QVD17_27496 [Tagetes erecta]
MENDIQLINIRLKACLDWSGLSQVKIGSKGNSESSLSIEHGVYEKQILFNQTKTRIDPLNKVFFPIFLTFKIQFILLDINV